LGDEQNSVITALPNGGYVVVWQATNQGAYGNTIVARLFDQQGYPVTPELLVNAYAFGLRFVEEKELENQRSDRLSSTEEAPPLFLMVRRVASLSLGIAGIKMEMVGNSPF